MIELIKAALAMGWPALGILVGLMFYFKASISDPVANKRAVFKTFIGIIGAMLLFMAIANYKMNFFEESRLLPVSLVLITSMTFMMALYFTNISALLKIGGFMFFIAAALSGYGNWLPQVEGGFPPIEEKKDFSIMPQTELADEGEKIIFGGVGQNKVQGAIGKGQCPLCHAFHVKSLFERGYSILGVSGRIDETAEKFEAELDLIISLAETETALRRVGNEIQMTRRRVNALEQILIPELRRQAKYIEITIDERDREDLYRLKKVKKIIERKKKKVETAGSYA